jgi:hypothetical protein
MIWTVRAGCREELMHYHARGAVHVLGSNYSNQVSGFGNVTQRAGKNVIEA